MLKDERETEEREGRRGSRQKGSEGKKREGPIRKGVGSLDLRFDLGRRSTGVKGRLGQCR